jgi:hypothetical protein
MPPSLLTLSLTSEEDNRRKIEAMKRSAEGKSCHINESGIGMGVVRMTPEHKQSAKLNQEIHAGQNSDKTTATIGH